MDTNLMLWMRVLGGIESRTLTGCGCERTRTHIGIADGTGICEARLIIVGTMR